MSNLNRNKLTVALAAVVSSAFALPAFAGGAVTNAGVTEAHLFASEVTGGNAATSINPTAKVEGQVNFTVSAPDILIGRTNTSGDITVVVTLTGAVITGTPTLVVPAGTPQPAIVGTNSFQFTITPPAAPGFGAGTLFSITGGTLSLQKATGLQPGGGDISATVTVQDTNTGILLTTAPAKVILGQTAATSTTFDPLTQLTIDVAAAINKTQFLVGVTNQKWAQIGKVTFAQRDVDSVNAGLQVASAMGTGALANVNVANRFQFNAAADTGKLTLTVPNAAAFTGTGSVGFWASQGACALTFTAGPTTVKFVVNATDATKFSATVPIDTATGAMYNLCAVANGTTAIARQTINASAQIDIFDPLGRDPAAVSADIAELNFNGTVVEVATFNPAGNTTQESFLRVTNPSNIDGLVTVEGFDDAGTAQATPITFTLAAGDSKQFNSTDLENGNAAKGLSGAFGDGTGKWRLIVTGEFADMVVSSLNRNNDDGTLTNLSPTSNDADGIGND